MPTCLQVSLLISPLRGGDAGQGEGDKKPVEGDKPAEGKPEVPAEGAKPVEQGGGNADDRCIICRAVHIC